MLKILSMTLVLIYIGIILAFKLHITTRALHPLRHSITIFVLQASRQKMLLYLICQILTVNRSINIFTYESKENKYLIKVDLLVKGKYISKNFPFFLVSFLITWPGTLCMPCGLQKLYISKYTTNITLAPFKTS